LIDIFFYRTEHDYPSSIEVKETFISDLVPLLARKHREVCDVLQYDNKEHHHKNHDSIVKAALRSWINRDNSGANLRNLANLLDEVRCMDESVTSLFKLEAQSNPPAVTVRRSGGGGRSRERERERSNRRH
jgi:hypothetical protein